MTIKLIGGIVKSLNGPGQDRRVTDIKLKPILLKGLTCLHSLLNAYHNNKITISGQLDIRPTGKTILLVPTALAVSQEDHTMFLCDERNVQWRWMRIFLWYWTSFDIYLMKFIDMLVD